MTEHEIDTLKLLGVTVLFIAGSWAGWKGYQWVRTQAMKRDIMSIIKKGEKDAR